MLMDRENGHEYDHLSRLVDYQIGTIFQKVLRKKQKRKK